LLVKTDRDVYHFGRFGDEENLTASMLFSTSTLWTDQLLLFVHSYTHVAKNKRKITRYNNKTTN